MLGDRIKVLDELYLAKASLIPGNAVEAFKESEVLECFLVKPVVKRSILGERTLLGYVEAITGIRVCDVKYVPDVDCGRKPILVDSESKTRYVGDIYWDIESRETADKVCKEGAVDWYFKHADFDVEGRIKYVREQSYLKKESYKTNSFIQHVRQRVKK